MYFYIFKKFHYVGFRLLVGDSWIFPPGCLAWLCLKQGRDKVTFSYSKRKRENKNWISEMCLVSFTWTQQQVQWTSTSLKCLKGLSLTCRWVLSNHNEPEKGDSILSKKISVNNFIQFSYAGSAVSRRLHTVKGPLLYLWYMDIFNSIDNIVSRNNFFSNCLLQSWQNEGSVCA